MMGSVAAIIVNWNSGALLKRCVDALQRQTRSLVRIIIVDNASHDDSITQLEPIGPLVTVIRLPDNRGFAAANNVALRSVDDCDWIALVNPDVFAEPDWLANLLGTAEHQPGYAFFGSRMLCADAPECLDGTGDIYHVSGLGWRRAHGQPAKGRDLHDEEIFSPCAAAALYRRQALQAVGGFDERYFCYFEDVDLGFRLQLSGYRCLYVANAVVYHVGSAITGKQSDFTIYHGHRNLVWTYFKNMPGRLFWRYLPQHLLLNLVTVLWFMCKGRGYIICKAKWDALKGLPGVIRQRQGTLIHRQVAPQSVYRLMAKGLFTPFFRHNI